MMTTSILGIDIAKKKFDVALLGQPKIKHKVFPNNPAGFAQLLTWLQKQEVTQLHACMEATSTYGEGLASFLMEAKFIVSIVNPARIKAFAQTELVRNKTDKADAKLIARFCLKHQPSAWQPELPHIRELQALVRRLDAVLVLHNQETNRLETAHPVVTTSIQALIKTFQTEIKALKKHIEDHINQYPDLRQRRDLLDSIPGVGDSTIAQVLAFIGDVTRFKSAKQVVAFVGLNPKHYSSGSSVRGKQRLSKTGSSALRKAFYMPAVVAMTHNPAIQAFCQVLKQKGKNGKVVVCAAMRKLVHIIFGVLKSGQPFNFNLAVAKG